MARSDCDVIYVVTDVPRRVATGRRHRPIIQHLTSCLCIGGAIQTNHIIYIYIYMIYFIYIYIYIYIYKFLLKWQLHFSITVVMSLFILNMLNYLNYNLLHIHVVTCVEKSIRQVRGHMHLIYLFSNPLASIVMVYVSSPSARVKQQPIILNA